MREFLEDVKFKDYFLDPIKTSEGIKYRKILRHGKPLLGAFKPFFVPFGKETFAVKLVHAYYESPLALCVGDVAQTRGVFCQVKLAFARGAVLIESIQGTKGRQGQLNDFSAAVGMPWPNFLVKKLEATGRRLGYREIRLWDVESSSSYKKHLQDAPETAKRMLSFYRILQKKLGFSEKRGDYWVKRL
ncbi:MAG: hypothetical protein V1777_04905 [Candidatus Micrarchaeota archaeon]